MTEDTQSFYTGLAPLYHLIYPDWEASIHRQAAALDALIREAWGTQAKSVLDVSCGIGTQALGLAELGYQVTASDLCAEEVSRAKVEAAKRGLAIEYSVADMRAAYVHHARTFDVVISCDNSIPHLLADEDILKAFRQCYQCTRTGGGCLISVRDYDNEDFTHQRSKPYAEHLEPGVRRQLIQEWEPHGTTYTVTMHVVEERDGVRRTRTLRTRYYAVRISRLIELMAQAGFSDLKRIDGRFFQPVLLGTRKR